MFPAACNEAVSLARAADLLVPQGLGLGLARLLTGLSTAAEELPGSHEEGRKVSRRES